MQREDNVKKTVPSALLTLRDKKRTGVLKILNELPPLCFFYEMVFKTFSENHELGVYEEVKGRVNSVPAKSPYNIRTVQEHDHVENDVFGQNDINEMGKVLRYVMRLGAHRYLFHPVVQLAIHYKAFEFDNKA